MHNLIMIILVAMVSFPLTGCVTILTSFAVEAILPLEVKGASIYLAFPEAPPVETTAYFSVGEVKDVSRFKFFDGDKDAFDLKEIMKTQLQLQFDAVNPIYNDSPQYVVNISMSYNPRSEEYFYNIRGKTILSLSAIIVDQEGNQRAYSRVYVMLDEINNTSVFARVAESFAETIRNPDSREVPIEYKYYEQAREEIKNGTVDKELWTRALAVCGSDEEMAAFEYIHYRSKQIYWSNPAAENH